MNRSLSESKLSIGIIHDIEEIKQSENNIVLFGSVGNGKTFLLNKLCGTDYLTADNGYSCTRNIQIDYSLKYDMPIIDFPGLNAVQDIMLHLRIQKTTLSHIPVRLICFVIKYSPRNDDFERELGQMLSIFQNYIQNVMIFISKSEDVNLKRKEEIKFIFKNKFNIEKVLFTTKSTDGLKLCEDLNKFKNQVENIKQILVKTRDLAKTVPSLYNKDMAKEREQYEDLFYKVLDEFKKEVEKAKDPDLKRALYFAFKDYKDYLLEEYSNVIRRKKIDGKEPDMDSVIAEILMFDNNVYNEFNEFRKQIESQIEIKSSNYNGEYNRFKKCPHCGVIWFKIKGCNSVQCGKRTKATDKIVGKYKNYTVKYINGKVEIHSEDLGNDNDLERNPMMMSMNMNMSMGMNPTMNMGMNPMMNMMMNNSQNPMMNNNQNPMMNYNQNPMMNSDQNPMTNNNQNPMMNSDQNPMMNNNQNSMMNSDQNPMINNNQNPMINNSQNSMMNNDQNPMMSQMNQMNPMSQMNMMMMNQMNQMNQMIQMNPMNQMNMMMNQMNIENDDEFIGLTRKENIENEKREKKGMVKITPVGCGRELSWDEMEDCSNEVIEKLKEIAADDYYSGLMKVSNKINKE